MPIPTGDEVTTNDVVTFCLTVPDEKWIVQVVQGLISEALSELEWEQVGTMTEIQAAEVFEDIFLSFVVC